MRFTVLLGPQRFDPSVVDVLNALDVRGPIAVVTAGWQEREAEDDELRQHVGRELINLRLYERYDAVMVRDPDLASAMRERQERLIQAQTLYRRRLSHLLAAARELMTSDPDNPFLAEHRREAIRGIRTLDRQQLQRLRRFHEEFDARLDAPRRPVVAWHRTQLHKCLERCSALAVAGGHVAVLLNRMRLFDLLPLCEELPVVAWSAGAMMMTPRIVLFHDSPPQGPGDPEVFDAGLNVCPDVVALPHADRRLRLDDPVRVSLFARRFSPATCVVLDRAARMTWTGRRWLPGPGTRRLRRNGEVRAMVSA